MLKEVDVGNLLEVGFLVVLHLQEVAHASHQVWVFLRSCTALEFVERQIEEIHSEGVGCGVLVCHKDAWVSCAEVEQRTVAVSAIYLVALKLADNRAVLISDAQHVIYLARAVGALDFSNVDILHFIVGIEDVGVEICCVENRGEHLAVRADVEVGVVVECKLLGVPCHRRNHILLLIDVALAHANHIHVAVAVLHAVEAA